MSIDFLQRPRFAGTNLALVTDATATGLMNVVEVDLGSTPRRSGHFDITTTGLTIGQNVIIEQMVGPYTGKGTLADEAEMDQISVVGQTISSTVIRCYWTSPTAVRGNFKFAYTLVSDVDAGVTADLLARTTHADMFSDFVVSGFNPSLPGVTLTMTTPSGIAYIGGSRVTITADTSRAYTASRDTYLDVNASGTYTAVAVTNGAAEPAVTSNSLRILKVVTSGTQVTAITQRSQYTAFNKRLAKGAARFTYSGTVTATDGVPRKLTTPAVEFDVDSAWDSTNTRYTCPLSGLYQCVSQVASGAAPTAASYLFAYLYRNGSNSRSSPICLTPVSGYSLTAGMAAMVYCAAGDYLELWGTGYNAGAGTFNITSGYMEIAFMGGTKNVPGP